MAIFTILSTELEQLCFIDDHYSAIWAERYTDLDDIELELPIKYAYNDYVVAGNFVISSDSDRIMEITDVNPVYDPETGSKFIVKGVDCVNILSYRVLEETIDVNTDLLTASGVLVDAYFTNPADVKREIDVFAYEQSDDDKFDYIYLVDQLDPQNIFEIIHTVADLEQVGMTAVFSEVDDVRKIIFSLHIGVNRSYEQTENPYIVFSDGSERYGYDNVLSSSYVHATRDHKNISILVHNEPEAIMANMTVYDHSVGEPEGLARREKVTTISTIDRDLGDSTLDQYQVRSILITKALDDIWEDREMFVFDGEIDAYGVFKYDEDYFVGDIIQCILGGKDKIARIVEVVKSYSPAGHTTYVSLYFGEDINDHNTGGS